MTSVNQSQRASQRGASGGPLLGILLVAAAGLALLGLSERLPPSLWLRALWDPDAADMRQMLVHHSFLPRLVVSLLAGAALGLAGALFQQALQNPLAEPATLGVSASAYLAVLVTSLFIPSALPLGREAIALAGAAAGSLLVFGLAHDRLSPLSVVLAGLVVNVVCGSLSAILAIFNFDYLTSVFIWGSGSLAQNDWSVATYLLPRVALAMIAGLLIARPLALLDLGDAGAGSLGASARRTRLLALLIAIGLSAVAVSAVGTIGFIGLAAPLAARIAGGRSPKGRLTWSLLFGAVLLLLADQSVQWLAGPRGERLPTGIATALLGAVLLLELARQRKALDVRPADFVGTARRPASPAHLMATLIALAAAAVVVALALGRGEGGWIWDLGSDLFSLHLRMPRVAAAFCAGAMLGAAGLVTQRLMGNPLAGPEVLGVSSAAALGAIVATYLPAGGSRNMQLLCAAIGAGLALIAMLASARKHAFAPERLLLTGVALGALLSAIVALLVASGDPRAVSALSWMAGSTYRVGPEEARKAFVVALVLLGLSPFVLRWLELLPLGAVAAKSLGVSLAVSRLSLLALAASLAAAATLLVGPLSFVGVMAPHLGRAMGFGRVSSQLAAAVLLGATVLTIADWVGRNLLFPWEIPAGILAALVGGPYLIWLLKRAP